MPEDMLSLFVVLLIVVPLASAGLVALLGAGRRDAVRWVSLGSTLLSLVLSVVVTWDFVDRRMNEGLTSSSFTPVYDTTKFDLVRLGAASNDPESAPAAVRFHVGIDGLNVWLVGLTALLMVCAILASWESITERANEYFAWMLMLQMAMVGVFLAFDIILFYVFFELTLIPLFFLIGIWGGPQRQTAARRFFIYTLTGSLITLLGVLGAILVFSTVGYSVPEGKTVRVEQKLTFSIPELVELTRKAEETGEQTQAAIDRGDLSKDDPRARTLDYWRRVQFWVFLTMMVGFAVKVPLVPVHTWLPLAHVEAPTAGSVLLAGVLLKIGTYGFLRLCLPLAPEASLTFGAPFIGWLAVVGIIYGAFCALQQDDVKKMVAYSSVSHLGFCMLGMFALNEVGITGSLLQMINHGLSTGALFLLVGMLYDRYHTRKIAAYGGMGAKLKLLAVFFVFITMSSIGLPGLNGFIGEFNILAGMFGSTVPSINGILLASLGALGVVLGAWYMLTLLRGVFFGDFKEPHHEGHGEIHDLGLREITTLVPIAALCLWIGFAPQLFIQTASPEIKYVSNIVGNAQKRHNARVARENAALAAAADTETRNDLSQIQAALAQFKVRFQLAENPPSQVILHEQIGSYGASQLEQDSLAFLKKVWGDQLGSGNVHLDWNGDGVVNGPHHLQGHQCLVFLLGGIASGKPISLEGFSRNPRNPTQAGGERTGPFFTFRPDRLQSINGFSAYRDRYGTPYAYFSSYKVDNGYNRYGTSDCASLNVSPYQILGTPARYYNPRSFQIISAGKSQAFGSGGLWGPNVAVDPRGIDDLSNFSDRLLGVP
jgi:NADH-quinone oxidoreductase subunit M